jgi:hypothetical protein
MPTHGPNGVVSRGLGEAARAVTEHASTIARLEARLAALELKQKVAALGLGIGLGLGAGLFGFFAVAFLLAALAAALATAFSLWASLLLVGAALLLVTGALALAALKLFRAGTPPLPEQALAEARLTTEALTSE